MRLLLLPVLAAALGAPSAPPTAKPVADMPSWNPYQEQAGCPETPMSLARKQGENPRARNLTDLPDAMMFAAVDRRIDRCPAPLVLSRQPRGR
ncbi:hypothetical protein [Sphingomonas arenae]|uniref:hypothetical protein n=1 Tax=Sphingomonas arenae TaxID=2812555 RepID=UPI001966E8BF|nr:hypothetical protein [Sphingomonas arenae]